MTSTLLVLLLSQTEGPDNPAAGCPASITFYPWRQLHFPIGLLF